MFLNEFGAKFANEQVRSWVWSTEDEDSGKRTSWPAGADPVLETVASVELMENQVQLTITQRDIATSSEDVSHADAQLVFDALIHFEEQSISLDGEPVLFGPDSIVDVIQRFNRQS